MKFLPNPTTRHTQQLVSIWITFLVIFDIFITCYWVSLYGPGIEANPIGRLVLSSNLAICSKVFFVIAVLCFLDFDKNREILAASLKFVLLASYAALAVYHVILLVYHFLIIRAII